MKSLFLSVAYLFLHSIVIHTTNHSIQKKINALNNSSHTSWANETLATLSRAEKIGQLIALRVDITDDIDTVIAYIERYNIGNIIPLDNRVTHVAWNVEKHSELIGRVRSLYPNTLQVPLLVVEDAEWGCAMRISELSSFPRALTLGALYPDNVGLIYEIGYAIGLQCKSLGIHLNCAPVVDVNSNYNNPVIGMRSFGSTPEAVGCCALAYINGVRDAGVLACIKHFPGHGNTDKDSHFQLPIIKANKEYLQKNDIAPFFYCLQHCMPAVMIGHLAIPALAEGDPFCPATLSPDIVTNYLQQKLGFSGLIISDALDMNALAAYGNPGDIALQALKAGIDILLCPPDVEAVLQRINQALDTDEYTETELNMHVLKILQVKEELGLNDNARRLPQLDTYEDLIQAAYDAAATAYNGFDITGASNIMYEPVALGTPRSAPVSFYNHANSYKKPLLVHLYPGSNRTHKLSAQQKDMIAQIAEHFPESIILLFGSPYCLMDIPNSLSTLVLYEDTQYTHTTAEKMMTGELKPQGRMPIEL